MTPVILYQMGKVGSSSLKQSLEENNIKTLHVHRCYFSNNERRLNLNLKLHKIKSNIVFKHYLKSKKVKIITFYRDPLPRNISSFFQNLEFYYSKRELKTLSYEQLEKGFNEAYYIHQTPNNWFDLEFKRWLNIDVFNFSFNKEKGYFVISKENIEIFICVTDKISDLEKELGEFLEIKKFKLINNNIGEKKWYKHLYKEFKKKYRPSKKLVDMLYTSKTINHFFKKKKIDDLRKYWD